MTWKYRYSPEPLNESLTDQIDGRVRDMLGTSSTFGSYADRSIPQSAVRIPFVTELPVAPADGDEIRYLADATNGVVWNLRYRNAAPSDYRWEFIGGSPIFDGYENQESTTSTSYTSSGFTAVTVTLPLAGDYMVEIGGKIQAAASTGNASAVMSYDIGATAASDLDTVGVYGPNPIEASVSRMKRKDAIPANTTLTAKYKLGTGTGTAYYADRFFSVTPIRVGRV